MACSFGQLAATSYSVRSGCFGYGRGLALLVSLRARVVSLASLAAGFRDGVVEARGFACLDGVAGVARPPSRAGVAGVARFASPARTGCVPSSPITSDLSLRSG